MSYLKVTKHVLTEVARSCPWNVKNEQMKMTLPKLKSLSVSHDPLLRTGLMGTELVSHAVIGYTTGRLHLCPCLHGRFLTRIEQLSIGAIIQEGWAHV